jgi:hypothetical protein
MRVTRICAEGQKKYGGLGTDSKLKKLKSRDNALHLELGPVESARHFTFNGSKCSGRH